MHLFVSITFYVFLLCSKQTRAVSEQLEGDFYYPAFNWSEGFDWILFKTLYEPNVNTLISPISLKIALAVIYEGSSGLTKTEMEEVLKFKSKETVRLEYRQLLQNLLYGDNANEIHIATRLFLDTSITAQQKFSSTIKTAYNATIELTNFFNKEETSNKINSWIYSVTNGYITNLVSSESVDNLALLVANALFFKGAWRQAFLENNTVSGTFYTSPLGLANVQYMKNVGRYYYLESKELDAKILRIPYKGREPKFNFFIVLPNSRNGLPRLFNIINAVILKRNLANMDDVIVDVSIPKFNFDYSNSFATVLRKLGLHQIFSNTASLPGIARASAFTYKKLAVNDIRQKSGIEVNEVGSTIFSATDIQVGNKFGDTEYTFNAAHPFMFFIEEQNSGTILFVGKVENPLLKESMVTLPIRIQEEQKLEVEDKSK